VNFLVGICYDFLVVFYFLDVDQAYMFLILFLERDR